VNIAFDRRLTLGERLADKLADYAGSWRFISIFFVLLLLWVAINSVVLILKPFDPYPFILLNLILSCLAAIQAPVIMMSQNRQEAKDGSPPHQSMAETFGDSGGPDRADGGSCS
jgi:uncharacterized membrane protein